jgi:WD40-like Beta Propeller Repeat
MTTAIARLLTCALICAGAFAVACETARADVFGPISLVSSGHLQGSAQGTEQALYAHDSAISSDGRYVAFDGYFAGRTGVWRRDLQTGEVQPVAVGFEVGEGHCEDHDACDAELPSISENGQYVSFTTTARLLPQEDPNSAPDVYVRNMDVSESQPCEEQTLHPAEPCAYTLVSAVSGKTEALTYVSESNGRGAIAAGRTAISANGQEVAFVTTAISNLATCQLGAPPESACEADSDEAPEASTPAMQVAVRYLASGETELVSTEFDPSTGQAIPDAPVSATEESTYGAVFSIGGGAPQFPLAFVNRPYKAPPSIGASISADGSTVAWMGTVVYKQARMLPTEASARATEPLWRRIGDGPLTPTRRVTGGSEPENPACIASGETSLGVNETASNPCQGPFREEPKYGVYGGQEEEVIPQLSADGDEVAFLATAQLVALGQDFGLGGETEADDLFLVNMNEGLTRVQALRPLTELVTGEEGERPILDMAVSADGSQVAFTTSRILFPLSSPTYISQPDTFPRLAELFDVDLDNDTLTRVTRSYEGGQSEHPHEEKTIGDIDPFRKTDGALSPAFSGDGNTLVFSSTASNLVYGDGNTPTESPGTGSADGSDVFLVQRRTFTPEPAQTYVSAQPANPPLVPIWNLGVTALSLKNGSVRLFVEVPGAGQLKAAADSLVRVAAGAHGASARARRARRPKAATRGRTHSASAHTATTVARRTVASAAKRITVGSGGLEELTLTPAKAYRTLASRTGGLSASVSVAFSAPGHKTLTQDVTVSFIAAAKKKSKKPKSSHVVKRAIAPAGRSR